MQIVMDNLFKLSVTIASSNKQNIQVSDPLEVKVWAKFFNVIPKQLIASYSFYLMEVLRKRVAFCIETQTLDGQAMKSVYKRLSPNYKKLNEQSVGKFYYDTKFLMDSMQVWGQDGKVHFGIPKHIKHPTSGTPAYLIFKYLEFGTKRNGKQVIPPRPIIYPNLKFIIDNTDLYFHYFIKLLVDKKIKLKQ